MIPTPSSVKGGPARAEVSVTSRAKVPRASPYFIIPKASLLGDRGRRGVSSDKARQFQELLRGQITVVHHAALCLSPRRPPQLRRTSNIPPLLLRVLMHMLIRALAAAARHWGSWRKGGGGGKEGQSWGKDAIIRQTTLPSSGQSPPLNESSGDGHSSS